MLVFFPIHEWKTQLQVSALPHLSSRVKFEISFRKRLAVPCLACSGFAPFAAHPSPSLCSLVLLRARSLSSASITTTPSSPITPIPRRQHQHLSSPPHLQSINRPSQADTPSFPHYSSLHRHARAYRLLAIAAAGVIGTHLQHRDNSRGSCSSDLLLKFS